MLPAKLYAISIACPGRLPEVLCLETVSDTGDTGSRRLAIEYASRGCTSFQLHTLIELASKIFTLRQRSEFKRLPQRPTLDPVDGFVVRAFHVAPVAGNDRRGWPDSVPGPGTQRSRRSVASGIRDIDVQAA